MHHPQSDWKVPVRLGHHWEFATLSKAVTTLGGAKGPQINLKSVIDGESER